MVLKLDNICDLMQKTASPYLILVRNDALSKLTGRTILLYKNGEFWVSMALIMDINTLSMDLQMVLLCVY